MIQSWRWFGPDDPVTLADAAQAGASGIVTALHHRKIGEVWPPGEIEARKRFVERAVPEWPLKWVVVESVPVHDSIKTRTADRASHVDAYRETLRNLGRAGIRTVCYNFMPVVDWTRTDLAFPMPDGSRALRFDIADLAAFDIHILKRRVANTYSDGIREEADRRFESWGEAKRDALTATILAGLPGSEESFTVESFRQALARYEEMEPNDLRANLIEFLHEVVPAAAEAGVNLAIHPDDPPFPILGLPRCVSTEADLKAITSAVDDAANGITLCVGSLGARLDNDLPGITRRMADRINFAHLRNVRLESDGVFHEAAHLDGSTDMVSVVRAIVEEERRRRDESLPPIPMRPDHGHQMLGDLERDGNPGYSAIGRLRGLAELRGVERALLSMVD
jgi:mannonate dehydratase